MKQLLLIFFAFSPIGADRNVDKAAKARVVYARLLETIGTPIDAPVLRLLPANPARKKGYIVYKPGSPAYIDMDESVLDLCFTFGPESDAALACLLGHELAHFQYRHGGKQGFFSPVVMPNGSASSSANLEALADKSGVFWAYLAGYDAFMVAPKVYRKLYDSFGLSDQLPGYPSKSQRLSMVADTSARVRELAQLFEIGEINYLMQDYENAGRVFATLVSRYPTTVTLNNLGAVKLNQALIRMKLASKDPRLGYLFPVEFDADNRLLAMSRRDEELPWLPLLTDARHLFQTARAEQPSYQSAYQNEAITLYLLGESEQAYQLLKSQQSISPNAELILAIVQADLRQTDQARLRFQWALKRGAFRAIENTRIFEALQTPGWLTYLSGLITQKRTTTSPGKPKLNLPDVTMPSSSWQPLPVTGSIQYARTGSLVGYKLSVDVNNVSRFCQVIRSYQTSICGLALGSLSSRLKSYSSPISVVSGVRGTTFYEYQQGKKRLFLEYRQNRLIGWTLIRV